MKPRNFPGRKNDRRKVALFEAVQFGRTDEAAVLRSRIVPDEMARAVRTKKDRSARSKLRA
jgi:hypothetical protein